MYIFIIYQIICHQEATDILNNLIEKDYISRDLTHGVFAKHPNFLTVYYTNRKQNTVIIIP